MKKYLPLFLIFLLGLFLRFYLLGQVPVALHRDEAFLGYNAYSILKTGRDISGVFLPLHLKSFLFSPAGYSYFSIPFIWIFGLSAFSVRFASAMFGSITIIALYFLIQELFVSFKLKEHIGLFSAFLFSVSPWSINLSRTATENSIVTFFVVLGTYLFLKYISKKNILLLIFSFLSFFITLFIYQAPRAFLPIYIPFLFLFHFFKIKKRDLFVGLGMFALLIIIPIVLILKSPDLSTRIRTLNIVGNPQTKIMVNDWITTDGALHAPFFLTKVFHNKAAGYLSTFSENLASHFSYGFLFSDKGFPDRYRIPQSGLLYLFEIVLILFALVRLFSQKDIKIGLFLWGWIVIAFSGTALTFDDIPNLQRTLIALPAFSILSGFGASCLIEFLKNSKFYKIGMTFSCLIVLFFVGFYLTQYYTYGKVYRPWYRQDGYQELVKAVNDKINNFKYAVITDREGSPTIYFLFYSKYDPAKFQQETKNVNTFASDHISFAKYHFSEEQCPIRIDNLTNTLVGSPNVLYVNSGLCDKPIQDSTVIQTIKRVDGSTVFKLLKVN